MNQTANKAFSKYFKKDDKISKYKEDLRLKGEQLKANNALNDLLGDVHQKSNISDNLLQSSLLAAESVFNVSSKNSQTVKPGEELRQSNAEKPHTVGEEDTQTSDL